MTTKAKTNRKAKSPKYATTGTYAELAAKRRTASEIESPCAIVWDLCERMPKAKRKDVVLAAVAKGVAFYTARTQYQAHRAAKLAEQHAKHAKQK